MRIRLRRVHARLPRPARDATQSWWERSALLVEVEDVQGRVGRGEAAPLPGRSRETIDEVERTLDALGERALGLGPALLAARLGPSGALAVECARMELAALDPLGGAPTARAQVLLDSAGDALARAAAARARGVTAFKLKIGASSDELTLIRALRAQLGGDVQLMADANGTLAPGDARLRALADAGFALLEDPFPLEVLAAHRSAVPLPVALDEPLPGLEDGEIRRLVDRRIADALVLKPTLLGLDRTLRLSRIGVPCRASHAYESPLGMAVCAALARALGDRVPHGVAPYAGLDAWRDRDGHPLALPAVLSDDGTVMRAVSGGWGIP